MKYQEYRKKLRDIIYETYDLEEIKLLCFNLDMKFGDIDGSTRQVKASKLITFCERHGRVNDLIDQVIVDRPQQKQQLIEIQEFFQHNPQARLYLSASPTIYRHPLRVIGFATIPFAILAFIIFQLTSRSPVENLYYMFIVDASARMAEGDDNGQTKWSLVKENALIHIIDGLVDGSNYGLILLGGDQGASIAACQNDWDNSVSLASNNLNMLEEEIREIKPGGESPLTEALKNARDQLSEISDANTIKKHLFLFIGGGDSCDENEWKRPLVVLENSFNSLDVNTDLILFDFEKVDEKAIELLNADLEFVTIHVAETAEEAVEVAEDITIKTNNQAATVAPLQVATKVAELSATATSDTNETKEASTQTTIIAVENSNATATPTSDSSALVVVTSSPTDIIADNPTPNKPPTQPALPTQTTTKEFVTETPPVTISTISVMTSDPIEIPTIPIAATPSANPQPLLTHAPTVTILPSRTSTPSRTPTPTATFIQPTAMPSSTPSRTPTPTATFIQPTAIPSSTPSRTPTPTATFIQPTTIPSSTPTRTPTLTNTPTKTPITPTSTSTPTPTTTPEFIISTLPSQDAVFSPGCWLINERIEYHGFYQNQANLNATIVANGRTGQGLNLTIANVYGPGGRYAGWQVLLGNPDTGLDFSNYTSLIFYIRGVNGVEKPPPNMYLMMPQTTETFERFWKNVAEITTITTSWQQIVIPLSHYETSTEQNQQVSLENIHKIQILFEWFESPTSGEIYIDDICIQ